MKTRDYTCSIQSSVSAKEAYDKVARVSEWWAKDFKGSARNLGDTFTVRFGETFVDFKISEAVPDSRIVWQVANCYLPWLKDKTEWNGTSADWEISSSRGITTVTFTHHGLTPDVECFGACEKGWNGHIQKSLLNLLNVGKGFPE
jgi:hypothetical protein